MKIFFYTVAFILGLTSIWMSHWDTPRTELSGKLIASVIFFILCVAFVTGLGWYREKKRVQKIRSAVLTRPRQASAEEPAKD
jgi:hypothetical protein